MKIASETPGTIRYTINGEDPTEESSVYSYELEIPVNTTLKAKVFSIYHEPSDITSVELASPVSMEIPVGTQLGDEVVIYDRGSDYGDYSLIGDNVVRVSSGVDDGSFESSNWRFLIFLNKPMPTGGYLTQEMAEDYIMNVSLPEDIGYGKPNTSRIMEGAKTFSEYETLIFHDIESYNEKYGRSYFLPSIEEARLINSYLPQDGYIQNFNPYNCYWSSSTWHNGNHLRPTTYFRNRDNGNFETSDDFPYSRSHSYYLFRRI